MNIAIVFFSRTQSTKFIAEQIYELLEDNHNVTLLQISEKKRCHFLKISFAPIKNAYISSIIGSPTLYFYTLLKKTPEINKFSADLRKFDVLFIGSPIWYGRLPPAINTFVTDFGPLLSNKKIFIFITSGGGKGFTNYINVLKNAVEEVGLTVIGKLHKLHGSYLTKNDKKMIVDCLQSLK